MWRESQSFSIPFVSGLIYNNAMRTIDELVNEMYMDNEPHLEYMENMNGGDCDCNIHTTLNTIVKYWWDEEK